MAGDEKVTVSLSDIKALEKIAVQEAKLEILVGDFQTTRKNTDENVVKIFELLREFPKKVSDCSDALEVKIHADLEKHYATDADVKALRVELKNEISKISNRFKWTTGLIVAVAGAIQFITTMYFLTMQIQKLTVLG
ncbi:MAG: hypothetical protein K0U78_12695 [Actinomycetia bacterium]|nr:hypothetical protein [Actinomycetes bacterium]